MSRRNRDVIVVGASAGGVEALRAFAAGLPPDLPAAVLVVLHLPAGGTSALASILSRSGPLLAAPARAGEPLRHGTIRVGPPDHHLLVIDSQVALSHGPTENGHRPSINALFRSAACPSRPSGRSRRTTCSPAGDMGEALAKISADAVDDGALVEGLLIKTSKETG